ncbi:MAG TPA: RES domain-containing protein, partial [Cyclobacteriaceae bacterium]|nr:RES domain-containing protein [Cyclobacteriaceae bacterium]
NHYGTPDEENVPYVSEFGGYWSKTYNTDELVRWIIEMDAEEEIIDEIVAAIGYDNDWCLHNPEFPRDSEFLSIDWKVFCKMLKHKVRYVFFKYPKKVKADEYRKIEPAAILEKIGRAIIGLNLLRRTDSELFSNLQMYRARQHKKTDKVKSCKSIGPLAPSEARGANRFSPPGIPMFYGSKKRSTAILEVIDRKKKNQIVTSALFKNIKPLTLVDLTKIPQLSIFDLDKAEFYEESVFLKQFARHISKKIKRGESQHFEYVPTQVITEYFRHVLSNEYDIPIDGLIYRSSIVEDDECYVIFASRRHCKDEGAETNQTKLVLVKNSFEKNQVKGFRSKKVQVFESRS